MAKNELDSDTLNKLSDLAFELAHDKAVEEKAKAQRIETEERIAKLVPGPEKGSKTVTLPNGSKITVKRDLNFKADCGAIERICSSTGRVHVPVKVKTTRELDEKGYQWYRDNDVEGFAMMAEHVVVTPAKTAVTLQGAKS